jgi:hypothetical protein
MGRLDSSGKRDSDLSEEREIQGGRDWNHLRTIPSRRDQIEMTEKGRAKPVKRHRLAFGLGIGGLSLCVSSLVACYQLSNRAINYCFRAVEYEFKNPAQEELFTNLADKYDGLANKLVIPAFFGLGVACAAGYSLKKSYKTE